MLLLLPFLTLRAHDTKSTKSTIDATCTPLSLPVPMYEYLKTANTPSKEHPCWRCPSVLRRTRSAGARSTSRSTPRSRPSSSGTARSRVPSEREREAGGACTTSVHRKRVQASAGRHVPKAPSASSKMNILKAICFVESYNAVH